MRGICYFGIIILLTACTGSGDGTTTNPPPTSDQSEVGSTQPAAKTSAPDDLRPLTLQYQNKDGELWQVGLSMEGGVPVVERRLKAVTDGAKSLYTSLGDNWTEWELWVERETDIGNGVMMTFHAPEFLRDGHTKRKLLLLIAVNVPQLQDQVEKGKILRTSTAQQYHLNIDTMQVTYRKTGYDYMVETSEVYDLEIISDSDSIPDYLWTMDGRPGKPFTQSMGDHGHP